MTAALEVGVSGRTLSRNVGGNTTYLRNLQQHLPAYGVTYRVVPSPGSAVGQAASEAVVVPWKARRQRLGLVHYPTDTGAGPLLHRFTPPAVATIHGMASLHVRGVRSARAERVWRTRVGLTAKAADRVVTVSGSSARDLVQFLGLPARKVEVIHHGIDHERFSPEGPDARARLDLPERYVLYLGNLDPRKNVGALVAAFTDELARRHGAQLVVAGRHAWGCDDVLAQLAANPHAHYLGPVADDLIAPLMRGAAAFVFPSTYEGFGFPVLEAMACGTPVAATRAGALAEVGGDAVAVIDDPSAAAVTRALDELLGAGTQDDRIAAGVQHVRQFTWERSASRHAEVFREVAAC